MIDYVSFITFCFGWVGRLLPYCIPYMPLTLAYEPWGCAYEPWGCAQVGVVAFGRRAKFGKITEIVFKLFFWGNLANIPKI